MQEVLGLIFSTRKKKWASEYSLQVLGAASHLAHISLDVSLKWQRNREQRRGEQIFIFFSLYQYLSFPAVTDTMQRPFCVCLSYKLQKPSKCLRLWAGCGGSHLQSQHLGGAGKRVSSSRSSSWWIPGLGSGGYVEPYLSNNNINNNSLNLCIQIICYKGIANPHPIFGLTWVWLLWLVFKTTPLCECYSSVVLCVSRRRGPRRGNCGLGNLACSTRP